jgi:hypothetical protein
MQAGKSIVLHVVSIEVYYGSLLVALFIIKGLGEKVK